MKRIKLKPTTFTLLDPSVVPPSRNERRVRRIVVMATEPKE